MLNKLYNKSISHLNDMSLKRDQKVEKKNVIISS